jgi:hypothetical protein
MTAFSRLASVLLSAACAASTDAGGARNYELTAEISMPHLEDNLRYAITHETRCLSRTELLTVFPILEHPSLSGCTLHPDSESPDTILYRLSCHPDHRTTGEARWQTGPGAWRGTLRIRLGGKNMTFSQSITAVPLGQCRAR